MQRFNLYKMKNSSEITPMSINDVFPNEILEKILSKLDAQRDLLQARLVCHRWRLVLDEMVGYTMAVTSFYPTLKHISFVDIVNSLPKNLKPINAIKDPNLMSVRHLTIGIPGMLVNEGSTEVIQRRIVHIKNDSLDIVFPYVLKSLSCFEPIFPDLVVELRTMTTLTSLNISLLSLSGFEPESSGITSKIFLRSLKILTISETAAYPTFNSSTVTPQLNFLLGHLETPALRNLDVTYPVSNLLNVDEDSTRQIMKFLERTPTIRKLFIMLSSPNQTFISPTKDFIYPAAIQEEMELLGRKLHITLAQLKDNHLHSLRPSTHVKGWSALLKQQRSLAFLNFSLKSSIELNEDVIRVIQNNAATLKTLRMACFPCEIRGDTGDIYFVPVDSSLLSSCCVLENLRMSDTLTNTMDLPPSLKKIYVDAMLTNKDASDILLSPHGALEQIELKDARGGIPKGFGYGVSIETLTKFAENRRVKRLIIYSGSLDGRYPEEGIPNLDPLFPKGLRRKTPPTPGTVTTALLSPSEFENYLAECVRIQWILNERGFFDDGEKGQRAQTRGCLQPDALRHNLFTSDALIDVFR